MTNHYCAFCENKLYFVYDGRGMACPDHGIIGEDFYRTEWDIAFSNLCKEYYRVECLDYDSAEFDESGFPEVPEWLGKYAYSWEQEYKRIIKEEPNYKVKPTDYFVMRYHNMMI